METMKITLQVFENGIKCWYLNAAYHRDGEHPAVIYPDDAYEYHIHGELIKIVKSGQTQWFKSKSNEAIDRR